MTAPRTLACATHEVLNQAPAMVDYDAYSRDPALPKIPAALFAPRAHEIGKRAGRSSAHFGTPTRNARTQTIAHRVLPQLT